MSRQPYVCFSHGKESGPWGSKISAMADLARDRGLEVESIDYRGMDDPAARVAKLVAHCQPLQKPLVLVGSSMGGHVAAAASAQLPAVRGLFLIAPAFYMPGYEALTPTPRAARITIVHGWRDDVVPVDNSIRFAREQRAGLHLIDGDHRLTDHIFEINRFFDWFLDDV
ncbi:alpha/beta fold hydrolase [Thioalkalivibrio sp. XN279]|uniref:alpha/beta fold hydrolase n=1 Tax=Thioalkalivibrio sp. XN279 TaxID=2714953 RepID=UPI00140AAEBE|nr:alpha/beta fold hydrolase [Thioalkalivibrio sp. XN279]NHA13418.1 alpha/beta fold hydrolase [Thioalkalivibrio sp. XN279]